MRALPDLRQWLWWHRWREALALRDRMLSEGVRLDGYTFSALIEACSKGGNVSDGFSCLKA